MDRLIPGDDEASQRTFDFLPATEISIDSGPPSSVIRRQAMAPAAQKARGAYYTDPVVASFLVRWAMRSPTDRVLDPCFGEGVFLSAAVDRSIALGGTAANIVGIELHRDACALTKRRLRREAMTPSIVCTDFFHVKAAATGLFSAVVGNPPFIRYQRFNGEQRKVALRRAAEAGVSLSGLTSAWAPFLVHATTFLEPGGRLAVVSPAELCHAVYARPLLRFLRSRFKQALILTFSRRLFPELSADTVLILADGYGTAGDDLRLLSLRDASALETPDVLSTTAVPIGNETADADIVRLIVHLLPDTVRQLYQRLADHPESIRLGAVATTGIGYVTGNNDFFHLSASEAEAYGIPDKVLAHAVCRAAWLAGLTFTERDWTELDRRGLKTRLLHLSGMTPGALPRPVRAYVSNGERRKVHTAYKCRVRRPWYGVPHVSVPDLFLTYMAHSRPALVLNRARAVAPNTLLCVHVDRRANVKSEALAAGWWTSLAALSAEIEGHSLGGGMLKLEPREAGNLVLPLPARLRDSAIARQLVLDLDRAVRSREHEEATDLADREILQRGLGLSRDECALLREGAGYLANRRRMR
jgi:adenine-specific DNA methylase